MTRRQSTEKPRGPRVRGLVVVEDFVPVKSCRDRADLIERGLLKPTETEETDDAKPRRGEG